MIKWPLDQFLAYCEHGMRFPPRSRNGPWTKLINEAVIGESKHCGNIKSITKNMNHMDANIQFCTGDYKGLLLNEYIRISTDFMNIRSTRINSSTF